MSYIKDILDAKASLIEESSKLPNVNPSFVINLPGDGWKPLILSFASEEQVFSMGMAIQNVAFALALGHSRNKVPVPDMVTLITPAELYSGENDDEGEPIEESRQQQGYAITSLTMKKDRKMLFNSRNIMTVWDDEKGLIKEVTASDDKIVAVHEKNDEIGVKATEENEPDFYINKSHATPMESFWETYESTIEAYNDATKKKKDDMDKTAREILSTVLPWLMADGTLNHINSIGHEL